MNTTFQTIIALALVFLVALLFIRSWWKKWKKPGCGGGCGCPGRKISG